MSMFMMTNYTLSSNNNDMYINASVDSYSLICELENTQTQKLETRHKIKIAPLNFDGMTYSMHVT